MLYKFCAFYQEIRERDSSINLVYENPHSNVSWWSLTFQCSSRGVASVICKHVELQTIYAAKHYVHQLLNPCLTYCYIKCRFDIYPTLCGRPGMVVEVCHFYFVVVAYFIHVTCRLFLLGRKVIFFCLHFPFSFSF